MQNQYKKGQMKHFWFNGEFTNQTSLNPNVSINDNAVLFSVRAKTHIHNIAFTVNVRTNLPELQL